jgi:glycosyltransferase involved in cell wall biosynthesis
VKPLRVGVVCDFAEERWPSMDLIADMLLEALPAAANGEIAASRLQPPLRRRWTRVPFAGGTSRAQLADRLTGRYWDYPRWLAGRARDFDVFHIVDHSYAHLARVLPEGRAIVTCHDLDAIRAVSSGGARRLDPERLLATRILAGLKVAAHVACVSEATSTELMATRAVDPKRMSVVYEGVHPSCTPGPRGAGPDLLLHVGSTIPRKRIDVLLEIFAALRRADPGLRLARVGGPLTADQSAQATTLGVLDAIDQMPSLDRSQLANLYRRATLVLLPSDREGFGLPLVEAMACGTPVVASAIPALQEIGSGAAVYCPPGEPRVWVEAVKTLLQQRVRDPGAWEARRAACLRNAARFNWDTYAMEMTKLYLRIGPR